MGESINLESFQIPSILLVHYTRIHWTYSKANNAERDHTPTIISIIRKPRSFQHPILRNLAEIGWKLVLDTLL